MLDGERYPSTSPRWSATLMAMSAPDIPKHLLEVAPGSGWLARESDRVVWIPDAVSIDTAHECIEPILTAQNVDEVLNHVRHWPEPSLPFIVLSLKSTHSLITSGFVSHSHQSRLLLTPIDVGSPPKARVFPLPAATRFIGVPHRSQNSSGMLVEGVIRAGAWQLHRSDPANVAPLPKPTRKDWHLVGLGHRWPIGDNLVIGRSSDSPVSAHRFIALRDPAVSRVHAVLHQDHLGPKIIDSSSRNGTWVLRGNRKPHQLSCKQDFQLADGDTIVIGQTLLSVRSDTTKRLLCS